MRGQRQTANGFTLLEMLVVLAIVGMVAGLVAPRVLATLSQSRHRAALVQIEAFRSAIDLFRLDTGRLPSAAEGLCALLQRPPATPDWSGPYLKTGLVPRDPWGGNYLYRVPGQTAPFDLVSQGPNGRELLP